MTINTLCRIHNIKIFRSNYEHIIFNSSIDFRNSITASIQNIASDKKITETVGMQSTDLIGCFDHMLGTYT